MFNNRDAAVYAQMLNAHVETYDRDPKYTKYAQKMAAHSYGVEHENPRALSFKTGMTACSELHFALNRVDSYTAHAMLHELRKQPEGAAACRRMAALWYAYFNDAERQELADIEDDERCARAEAAEAARYEEMYR